MAAILIVEIKHLAAIVIVEIKQSLQSASCCRVGLGRTKESKVEGYFLSEHVFNLVNRLPEPPPPSVVMLSVHPGSQQLFECAVVVDKSEVSEGLFPC